MDAPPIRLTAMRTLVNTYIPLERLIEHLSAVGLKNAVRVDDFIKRLAESISRTYSHDNAGRQTVFRKTPAIADIRSRKHER